MSTLKTDVLKDVAETVTVNIVDIPNAVTLRADLANSADAAKGAVLVARNGGGTLADLFNSADVTKGSTLIPFSYNLLYSGGVGAALNGLYSKVLYSDDFAADDTGVTSASAAINSMFTAAKAGGKVVVIRPGTYKITTQCDYSGLSVFAHGATFNIDHSAADPTQDVTGFRAIASDSHWQGGIFDIVGTSFNQGNAANINGTRQGGFWIGEYFKAGVLTRIENISLADMRFRCTGGFYGLNQVQLTGNLSGVKIDQVHGNADGRAGRLIAFEWGKDTVANTTYHPENIELGVISGEGYRQKFSGAVVFMSGVTGVTGALIRGKNVAQTVRLVAGDFGETLAMPQYVGRVLKAINFGTISSSESQWRGLHVNGLGGSGNVTTQVSVVELLVTGNGSTTVGGYFEGTSVSFAGGETGSYTTVGMKAVYRALGAIDISAIRVQDFAGYAYFQGNSSDADASINSFGTGHVGLLDAQNIGGPAYFISAPTASFEVCRIDQINAQACSMDGGFTGNLDCFGGYGVADADLTRIVEISIGSGRIGAIGTGANFGIRSPGGAVRANYYGVKVGNGTVFATAVSHGSGGSNDRVTHVGCDFLGTVTYGGAAAVGVLA